jgi:hypothetical protein
MFMHQRASGDHPHLPLVEHAAEMVAIGSGCWQAGMCAD